MNFRTSGESTSQRPMSVREAIALALENNRDIEVTRKNVQIAEFDLKAARGFYEPRFVAQTFYERTKTPNLSIFSNNRETTQEALVGNADVRIPLPNYGTIFAATLNNLRPQLDHDGMFAQSIAGLGGDVQYLRTEASGAYYMPLFGGFIGKLQMRGGYITGFGGDDVRLQDRFYEGADTFRGFDVAGIGPRYLQGNGVRNGKLFGQAVGAKIYAIGTAEIKLPLPLPKEYGIRTSLFTDFGTVGLVDDSNKIINENLTLWVNPDSGQLCSVDPSTNCIKPIQDDLALRVSAGVSVSWDSPFGPVRFDFAKVLRKEEYDRTTGFRFSAGTSF